MSKEWKLVPVEPTGVMKDAGAFSALPVSCANAWIAGDVWRAMVAKSPESPQADAQPVTFDLDAAARKLAACMDYPWEHMPEQGRDSMRENAKAIIDAALSASAEPTNKEAQ